MDDPLPLWTHLPFVLLVLGIAVLPMAAPRLWGKLGFQALVALVTAAPIAVFLLTGHHGGHLLGAAASYASFVATIGALYVTTSGIVVVGDLEATPRTNVVMMAGGALLASVIGTTGASVLLIRTLVRTNQQRRNTRHLVPFFILLVANVGGLLTPLGDPPLLLGYLMGVPFFWTLGLFPYWLLYVGSLCGVFYLVDRRAYRRETDEAKFWDRTLTRPLRVEGKGNAALLVGVVTAVWLPSPMREGVLLTFAGISYAGTSRGVYEKNGFSMVPLLEVAVIFAGLFVCLVPVELTLAASATALPFHRAWQLFWGAGLLSSVLDNAPTYAAFAALARGLDHGGAPALVAGMSPVHLTAISVGSVVMGAMTYIGNGPNLIVKAIAERAGYAMPSFARYALFAVVVLAPLHVITTGVLVILER